MHCWWWSYDGNKLQWNYREISLARHFSCSLALTKSVTTHVHPILTYNQTLPLVSIIIWYERISLCIVMVDRTWSRQHFFTAGKAGLFRGISQLSHPSLGLTHPFLIQYCWAQVKVSFCSQRNIIQSGIHRYTDLVIWVSRRFRARECSKLKPPYLHGYVSYLYKPPCPRIGLLVFFLPVYLSLWYI